MSSHFQQLITGATLCSLAEGVSSTSEVKVQTNAAIGWSNGKIAFAGPAAKLPTADNGADEVIDVGGALVTPGLIDCHTHLVFGGTRSSEFRRRLLGESYESVARGGGGIAATVRETRAASEDELLAAALPRARALIEDGVTTLEIKSGYGLTLESELKMLRVARRLGRVLGVGVRTTFLGAHTVPAEFTQRADGYIDYLCQEVLPVLAESGLADAVDAYCEKIAFSPAQVRRLFIAAKQLGLPVKLHADQLSDLGGAALAAEFGALSADHLEYTDAAGVAALARAGTVAVMLPGAFYSLRETRVPPVAELRRQGVAMAIASDLNPGTSPLLSLRLALNMACVQWGLTPAEALRGATTNAARALGLQDRGRLIPGLRADLVIWNATHPDDLVYWMGGRLARTVIVGGQPLAL